PQFHLKELLLSDLALDAYGLLLLPGVLEERQFVQVGCLLHLSQTLLQLRVLGRGPWAKRPQQGEDRGCRVNCRPEGLQVESSGFHSKTPLRGNAHWAGIAPAGAAPT